MTSAQFTPKGAIPEYDVLVKVYDAVTNEKEEATRPVLTRYLLPLKAKILAYKKARAEAYEHQFDDVVIMPREEYNALQGVSRDKRERAGEAD